MENSPLALFEHEKFGSLRVVERKVQPWFVAAVRKAAALENELGRGRDYKSVKGIPWFLDVFADTPAAYHVDVIEAFRLALKNDLNMLGKYRLRRAA